MIAGEKMGKKFSDITYSEFIEYEKSSIAPNPAQIEAFILPWADLPDSPKCKNMLDFGSGNHENTNFKNMCKNYFPVEPDLLVDTPYRKLSDLPEGLKFDGVIANQVFEHIDPDEMSDILSEIYEKMSDNGIIVITVPNLKKWSAYTRDLDHKNRLDSTHVCCFLSMAGFTPVRSFYYAKHPARINRLITHSDTTKTVSSLLYDLYGIHPADFVAVIATKNPSSGDNISP